MTFLFILLGIFGYLATGTLVARNKYAKACHLVEDPKMLKKMIKEIRHANHCWLSGRYGYSNNTCDCSQRSRHRSLSIRLSDAEQGLPRELGFSPYSVMFLFPFYSFDSFIRGGRVKEPNHMVISRLEKELSINE